MKDLGSFEDFFIQVPLRHKAKISREQVLQSPIVVAKPSSSDSPVYFQEQEKKSLFSISVCLSPCVSTTSGIPRPGTQWNEKSTCTLQKWIRKHRGHNYQAPWCWSWRRWSANRSVSNHPPHCLRSVIQWVYSSFSGASNGP